MAKNTKKNENKGLIVVTPKADWQYRVNVEYDTEYSCGGFGPGPDDDGYDPCDPYCRCGTIVNARVEKLKAFEALPMATEFFLKGTGEAGKFGMALAVRFFRHALDEVGDMFEVNVSSGYYGEEVSGVRAVEGRAWSNFYKNIEEFNLASNSDRLKFVLGMEYGSILPVVMKWDNWCLVEVPVLDVHASKDVLERTSDSIVHYYQSYAPWSGAYCAGRLKEWYPGIVVVPNEGGEGYRVIDGFHRYKAWTERPRNFDSKKWKRLRKNKKIIAIAPVV